MDAQGSTDQTDKAQTTPAGTSWTKKIAVVVIAFFVLNTAVNQFAGPSPDYDHFSNDMAPGTTFDISFVLHDIKKRSSETVFKRRQLVYSANASESFTNFTLSLPKGDFEEDPNRYRMEVQAVYNSPSLGHVKTLTCYSHVAKPMETRANRGDFVDPIARQEKGVVQPHVFSKLHYQLVFDTNVYDFAEPDIPSYLYQQEGRRSSESSKKQDVYFPHLDCSLYWTLRRDKVPQSAFTNSSTIPIEVDFQTQKSWRATWAMKFYIAEQQTGSMLTDVNALEEFKTILSDNSFEYLVLLFSVNFFHTLFSLLSLKNNISFYSRVKSRAGLSTRKLYTDVLFQIVIFLYLLENDTSIVVVALTAVEGLVSIWIALKITRFEKRTDSRFPYYKLKGNAVGEEDETERYDRQATTFLSWVFLPLLACYIVYSYVSAERIALYPFALKSLVAFIHAVGFINMTPQIYINYKLKSVEHLPWKGMIYQFLNTIIDDLFAFAVKMPTLQRISVFRDDVIFVIYLVQKWIYRKNPKRNEEKVKTE